MAETEEVKTIIQQEWVVSPQWVPAEEQGEKASPDSPADPKESKYVSLAQISERLKAMERVQFLEGNWGVATAEIPPLEARNFIELVDGGFGNLSVEARNNFEAQAVRERIAMAEEFLREITSIIQRAIRDDRNLSLTFTVHDDDARELGGHSVRIRIPSNARGISHSYSPCTPSRRRYTRDFHPGPF